MNLFQASSLIVLAAAVLALTLKSGPLPEKPVICEPALS